MDQRELVSPSTGFTVRGMKPPPMGPAMTQYCDGPMTQRVKTSIPPLPRNSED